MPEVIHYRILCNATSLTLHLSNTLWMAARLLMAGDKLYNDPDLAHFYSFRFLYITIWNLTLQLAYLTVYLLCDVSVVMKWKQNKLMDILRAYRLKLFSGIIWPTALSIVTLFWPMYIYDRELVFPSYIDQVLSQVSNHGMHTIILPVVVLEFLCLPHLSDSLKSISKQYFRNFTIFYLIILLPVGVYRGTWPYPFLTAIFGTIYLFVYFLYGLLCTYISFQSLWILVNVRNNLIGKSK